MTNKLESGILTELMDIGSEDFKDFQRFIKAKANSRTNEQKIFVEQIALKFKIDDYLANEDKKIVSVGKFIKLFLKNTKIKQNRLAEYLGIKPPNLFKILTGERRVNLEVALMLENIIGVTAESLLAVQTKNEIMSVGKQKKKEFLKYNIKELIIE